MKGGKFNKNELKYISWQYSICHKLGSEFKKEEKIFLKSNPEVPLRVIDNHKERVTCCHWSLDVVSYLFSFHAAQVLRYTERAFVECSKNRDIKICLN